MIENVVSTGLFVDENLDIKRNRLMPEVIKGGEKRICIVTGTHGDELEGQYVCFELIRRILANKECLNGIVDVYPALNPMGIESIIRGIPMFDLDMNRIFPGSEDGSAAEYVASRIVKDISGADMCVDIHSSNIFLREIPQVRVSESTSEKLVPYASMLNIDFIWVHASSTVLQSTLAHSLNSIGVPTLVVEMGVGMRITKNYGEQLLDGIFNLMGEMGIWEGETAKVKEPIISTDGLVSFVNAKASGIFVSCINHTMKISQGEKLGEIINPISGSVLDEVKAPCSGIVFTLREYPVVYEGSLIARILGGNST